MSLFKRKLKGQYMSFDAIIAAMIFMTVFLLIITYWQSTYNRDKLLTETLNQEAIRISSLLLSEGSPILNDGVVDPKAFVSINPSDLSAYPVYVELSGPSGSPISAAGTKPPSNARLVAHVSRIVMAEDLSSRLTYPAVLNVFVYPK